MKSLEQQLTEQATEIRELRKKAGTGTGKDATITQLLSESGLPDAAQARIRKRLPAGKIEEIREAIRSEKDYVRNVRTSLSEKATQKAGAELADAYLAMGLSPREAAIAAGVESAVQSISESRKQLIEAGKLLGLNEREAEAFSQI
jgi:hypothetical protein